MEYLGAKMGRFGDVVMAACRSPLLLPIFFSMKKEARPAAESKEPSLMTTATWSDQLFHFLSSSGIT